MQQYQDQDDARETANSPRLIFAALGVVLLAIVVLATNYPVVSEWISAAAQAEFFGSDTVATSPTQIAQPLRPTRIVRSN